MRPKVSLQPVMCVYCWWAGGEEANGTSIDGSPTGSAGAPSSAPKGASVRQRLARAQSRHRLANKPQDFQVSMSVELKAGGGQWWLLKFGRAACQLEKEAKQSRDETCLNLTLLFSFLLESLIKHKNGWSLL